MINLTNKKVAHIYEVEIEQIINHPNCFKTNIVDILVTWERCPPEAIYQVTHLHDSVC